MRPTGIRRWAAVPIALSMLVAASVFAEDDRAYRVDYTVRIVPTERAAHVTVRIEDSKHLFREIRWQIDPERHRDFAGDGTIMVDGESVRWKPESSTSTLRYVFRIDHLRDERSYDARCAENWAIFRGDDLVPPARVRTVKGAHSISRLRLNLPDGWSVVAPYERIDTDVYRIDHPDRGFDRPTGWFAVGELGVLRESIAGSRVAVGGPVGQRMHRLDILALLRWTLPDLRKMVGELPDRLVVVGAGDPMWRGGLSGPRSAFVHSSRPLITEDATSPVLHELMHSALRLTSGEGGDWIIEALAEFYALEALVRSRTISRKRHTAALARLEKRGRRVPSLEVARSKGAVTARGVTVLYKLDEEIDKRTDGKRGLEDAVRFLMQTRVPTTTATLRTAAEQVTGDDLGAFFRRHVRGP